jgi:FkbM family methyltransferase
MKIIQVGANSGNDEVYHFIKNHIHEIDIVILVEPMPYVLDKLKLNYQLFKNIHIEPVAIVPSDQNKLVLYYEKNSINYEVCSFSKQHLLDHGCPEYKIEKIEVAATSINNLMKKYNLDQIDYLFIDTEGLDISIIKDLDFNLYTFNNIIFESAHTDGVFQKGQNYNNIVDYLHNLGYNITTDNHLNSTAVLQTN